MAGSTFAQLALQVAATSRVRDDPPVWATHLLAALVTALVVCLWFALHPLLGSGFQVALGFPAVALVAWYGGAGPGVVTTGLVAVARILDLVTAGSFPDENWIRLTIFVVSGALISGLAEPMHRARRAVVTTAGERLRVRGMLATSQHLAHVGS